MGHIDKTVSCKTIVAKIVRTFKPADSSWIRECIEDIGWAIQAIGYHTNFIYKATEAPYITVKNFRALIPCEVERLQFVEQLLPDNSQTNILDPNGTTPSPEESTGSCTKYRGIKMRKGSDMSFVSIPRTTNISSDASYYSVDGNYIYTQFETGLIKLYYWAFATDKEGLPLIIDDFDYKSCCEWYVVSQMILRGFKHPEISYKDAFTQFEMYRLRAENAVKILTLDDAEKFNASWCRYVSNLEFNQNFYMGLEQPEYISR